MPDTPESKQRRRLPALLGHEFFAPSQWKRRIALWGGGVLVGIATIVFTRASDELRQQSHPSAKKYNPQTKLRLPRANRHE